MKNYQKLFGIVVLLSASLLAGSFAVNAVSGDDDKKNQAPPDCSEKLRQSMDEMHRQMHSVKPSGDVDEDFVRLMLPHHEAAVEMAKTELLCGKDPVNRRLAQEIITEQQSEIELMNLWLSKRQTRKTSNHADHRHEERK
jgi:uncharacterized protein (DUF305 family)